ncbi:siderophore-interacting protein [Kineosporia babensis]|uniref:Siderophore-interacting protein n=1 Tax=Kineosporia babensis TaxID=499548 RepID=A0A9X1SW27_9ACTN|nr:siderophore-interacting protein [Kineosporia babensis]MCD5314274.1 siderophore-interacting protein [Kineosporia babensis]
MAGNWQRGVMRLMGIANHPVKVDQVVDITPWYRRIVFTAPAFVADLELFPTLWVRLWVPAGGNQAGGKLAQRAYTIVEADKTAGTFTVEFVLHEAGGPAGDWARQAQPGDGLEIAMTPARVKLPTQVGSMLLVGDVTALPAVNTWLAALPPTTSVTVLIEDGHPEQSSLPRAAHPNLTWEWIAPGNTPGEALAEAVAGLAQELAQERAQELAQEQNLFAWAAGERGLIKNLRPVLKNQLNLDRAHQFSQFYWMADKPFG